MTTLTLQVENPSILIHLKALLKSMHGVKVVSSSKSIDDGSWDDVPNVVTLAAMREAEGGNDAGTVSTENLESFIASMQ